MLERIEPAHCYMCELSRKRGVASACSYHMRSKRKVDFDLTGVTLNFERTELSIRFGKCFNTVLSGIPVEIDKCIQCGHAIIVELHNSKMYKRCECSDKKQISATEILEHMRTNVHWGIK